MVDIDSRLTGKSKIGFLEMVLYSLSNPSCITAFQGYLRQMYGLLSSKVVQEIHLFGLTN